VLQTWRETEERRRTPVRAGSQLLFGAAAVVWWVLTLAGWLAIAFGK